MEPLSWSRYLTGILITPLNIPIVPLLVRHWRYPRATVRNALIGLAAGLLVLNLTVPMLFGITRRSLLLVSYIGPFLCWVTFFALYKFRDGRLLFTLVTVMLLTTIDQVIADTFTVGGSWSSFWFRIVLAVVQTICCYCFLRKPYDILMNATETGWYSLCALPLLLQTSLIMAYVVPTQMERAFSMPLAWVLCITVCVVYVALYYLVHAQEIQQRAQQGSGLLHAQMRFLEQQSEQILAIDNENRMFRHDLRHYLLQMQDCVDRGDLAGMEKILRRMDRSVGAVSRQNKWRRYTGSVILDLVLSLSAERAEAENIQYTVNILMPEKLHVDTSELAVVLAGALDNAIEACLAIPEGGRRRIMVFDSNDTRQFFLSVRNTFTGSVVFDPDTGQPQPSGPGRGGTSRTIAAFAKKNNAFLRYNTKDGWFSLSLLM